MWIQFISTWIFIQMDLNFHIIKLNFFIISLSLVVWSRWSQIMMSSNFFKKYKISFSSIAPLFLKYMKISWFITFELVAEGATNLYDCREICQHFEGNPILSCAYRGVEPPNYYTITFIKNTNASNHNLNDSKIS